LGVFRKIQSGGNRPFKFIELMNFALGVFRACRAKLAWAKWVFSRFGRVPDTRAPLASESKADLLAKNSKTRAALTTRLETAFF
jgi:hypothetical protein